jgi:hypothetical protein
MEMSCMLVAQAMHTSPHAQKSSGKRRESDVRCQSLGMRMNSPGPTSHCKPAALPYRGNSRLMASFVISDSGVSARLSGMRAWLSLIVADTTRARPAVTLNSVYLLNRGDSLNQSIRSTAPRNITEERSNFTHTSIAAS